MTDYTEERNHPASIGLVTTTLTSRRTLGKDDLRTEFMAPCPVSGAHTPLETCVGCSRLHGLGTSPNGREVLISCRLSGEEQSSALSDGVARTSPKLGRADFAVVSEIMSKHVLCVTAELGVQALATLFLDEGISGAPVVDDEGRPIGVVSKTNLVRLAYGDSEAPETATVADIMMPLAFCLPVNESIAKAAALMSCEHIHRVPVVSASGRIVGIVSAIDVLTWLARAHGYVLGDGTHG
jgi:CBS domain-containing protein